MNSKKTCFDLLSAESEAVVASVLAATPEMDDPRNWVPLDNRETNFNTTSNQASDGAKALTELMTNMVDAVLIKAANQEGVPLEGPEAPQTMYEAVDSLVKDLRGGKLKTLGNDRWLEDFAWSNLVVGTSGSKVRKDGAPCFTFVDNGEGQHPSDFPSTFLSLSAKFKSRIPFVQGKFNMGSSGVLRFCGREWYKLIVSRKWDKTGDWGWTLIRRSPRGGDVTPVAEYFCPGGVIPSFKASTIYPLHLRSGDRYERVSIESGTIVKLYSYHLPARFPIGWKGLREALNENIVETILPFRLVDTRQTPSSKRGGDRALGVDTRRFYGMEYQLLSPDVAEETEEDEPELGEQDVADLQVNQEFSIGQLNDPNLGQINLRGILLGRNIQRAGGSSWLNRSDVRVFHVVNGQVQFKSKRGYLSQCGFPALMDRAVLIVDASNLSTRAHAEVFKSDREHLSATVDGERYNELVKEHIKNSEILKELQRKVAEEELRQVVDSANQEVFQKLIKQDPTLQALLSDKHPTLKGLLGTTAGDNHAGDEYAGKYSPSYLMWEGKPSSNPIPIKTSRPVVALTDAVNDYLIRADNAGVILYRGTALEVFACSASLKDGRLRVFLSQNVAEFQEGNVYTLSVGMLDSAMPEELWTEELQFTVVAPSHEDKKTKSETSSGGSRQEAEGKGREETSASLSMPPVVLLTEKASSENLYGYSTRLWPEGFNERDGGDIEDLGDGESIILINFDNVYHVRQRKAARTSVAQDAVTEKYILGMRVFMLALDSAWRQAERRASQDEAVDSEELLSRGSEVRRLAAQAAASVVLSLIETVPKAFNNSTVSNEDS